MEGFRLRRMKKEMTSAAKKKKIYHLWWHPHNFGKDMDKNFTILEKLLAHYRALNKKYNMQSRSMGEVCEKYLMNGKQ